MERGRFRLAATGDLHCRVEQHGRFRELVRMVNGEADGLVIAGDLTDRGLVAEAETLAEAFSLLRVPCAAVLGNHDFEAGQAAEVARVMCQARVKMLDGEHADFEGKVGVAGVKGFGGGFDQGTLQAFGEPAVKAFVQESVNEALKLEAALAQVEAPTKVVLLHHAPIADTTEGENVSVRAFLGTTRLVAPIEAFGAAVVLHGHAHHGAPEGRTPKGIPVYNVAVPVLQKAIDRRFRILEQ